MTTVQKQNCFLYHYSMFSLHFSYRRETFNIPLNRCLCEFYSAFHSAAPSAVREPNVDIVYAAHLQTNIQLRARVSGNGIKFVEWKFNGTGISQRENGVELSKSSQTSTGLVASLTISSYNSATHMGTYELLVTSQAGTASVATWLVRDAGNITYRDSTLIIPIHLLGYLKL